MSTTNFQKLYEESMYPTNTQFQNTYSTNQPQDGPTYQNKLYQPSSRTKINQYNQGTNFQNYVQKEKTMSIKWRDIMKIDLKFIQRTNDFTMLESVLDNLIYSNVSEEEIQSVPEGNIAKLIKIYQLTIEILLNSQQNFEINVKNLEEQSSSLNNEINMKNIELEENKNLIRKLKKEKKRDEMVLLTYKNVIDSLGRKKNKENVKDQNESLISSGSNGKYFCKYCTGKKFSTEEKLRSHMNRRHLIKDIPDKNTQKEEKQQTKIVEAKIDELKTHFEEYIKNNQNNNLLQYLESQKKIEEDFQGKKIEEMEKGFKETLKDLKDLYLQTAINKQSHIQPNYIIPQQQIQYQSQEPPRQVVQQPQIIQPNNEDNKILLDEISKMKQMILDLNLENQKKLQNIESEYEAKFKALKEQQELNRKTYTNEPSTIIIKNETQELKVDPQKSYLLQDTNISKSIIKQKKTYYNAGPIESDHDDTDEEKENEKKLLEEMKKTSSIFQKKLYNNISVEQKGEIELSLSGIKKPEETPLKKQPSIKEEESQKMNILDELDKKPFAKTQKVELKENVEHELEPKKESNKIKYQSQMNQTLSFEDQLRKFYDKYHERDNKFLEEPKPEYYSVEIL